MSADGLPGQEPDDESTRPLAPVLKTAAVPSASTGWSRTRPARAVREVVQRLALGPVLNSEVEVESRGSEALTELATSGRPMIIVANHASHLDTPVLLSSLPAAVRRRTVVAAVGGALFESGWRRQSSALIFNAVLLDTGRSEGRAPGRVRAGDLLDAGWNLLIYPEGRRSVDGFLGRFADLAARLAIRHQVPLVPAGVRGTYAVMPRGRPWPIQLGGADSRSRISVGYGTALHPEVGADPGEVGDQITAAVKQLIAEDATTWWQSQRDPKTLSERSNPPAGSWRRIWQQTQPPGKGGQADRPRIWPS